jgi:hypothetical protein
LYQKELLFKCLTKGADMGFLSNLFGNSNSSPVSNVNTGNLQILMKQIKKDSNWFEFLKTSGSTLYIDKNSCYADDDGSLFFLWRDVFTQKGDVFYFTLVNFNKNNTQDFYVLKQITQISKGAEQYSFKEDKYSIGAEDATVQKIMACANSFANENNYREVPEYIDGLA